MKKFVALVVAVLLSGCAQLGHKEFYSQIAPSKYPPTSKVMVFEYSNVDLDEIYQLLFSDFLIVGKSSFNGPYENPAQSVSRITKETTIQSLLMAIKRRQPEGSLINHSDRGVQYCSSGYMKMLKQFGMIPSMSRKGNCYDNAPMESFWGTLKNELIYQKRYATREEAIREITEYIEVFYNRQRRQKRLGYLSPVAYLRQFVMLKDAA